MQIVQIAHNAVTAKLYNADRQTCLEVSSALSYRVSGAEFTDAYRQNHWDGRSTFFDFRASTFPAGFVHLVYSHLTTRGYKVQLVRKPFPVPQGPVHPRVDDFPDDPRYSYQMDTINQLLKHGQMIAQVATGGGKSRIGRLAYARIRRPTLFLTTRSVLMYQMKENFESNLRISVGVMGDSEWAPIDGFNVGMVQTLAARIENKTYDSEIERQLKLRKKKEDEAVEALRETLKKQKLLPHQMGPRLLQLRQQMQSGYDSDAVMADKIKKKVDEHQKRRRQVLKVLELFELVILEEAHESSGNGFYEVMKHCKNAHYRLSLTATPFMKSDEEANMRLMACSGPIGIQISEQELINRGILARPYFKYVHLPCPKGLRRTTGWQRAYKLGITENEYRNQHIRFEAERMCARGLPVMILVQHKAHGRLLKKLLTDVGLKAEFIFGENNQAERQSALNRLGQGKLQVLIGSTILDVGVDVPAVGGVILAGGGKAEVALRQRIGRGLREKKHGPNVVFVVDFTDHHNMTLREHAMTRRAIVSQTPGFAENILPDGDDFNYEGLNRVA